MAVIGHSEGACLAAALGADREVDPAAVVLIACPAVTGREVLLWQSAKAADSLSAPVRSVLRLLRIDVKAQQRKALDKIARRPATPRGWIAPRQRPLAPGFLDFDPKPLLREIRSPVLAITGRRTCR